jgi:hypothetical protein
MGPRFMSRGEGPRAITGHRAPNVRSWPIAAPSRSRQNAVANADHTPRSRISSLLVLRRPIERKYRLQ